MTAGEYMFKLAEELWPIGRSLSGPGVRETLEILKREVPELEIKEFRSGDLVFDWEIPNEWTPVSATLTDPSGRVICDYSENNLRLLGYSIPISGEFSLEELQSHLFSLKDQPHAIPYVTSYYRENWGFCLTQIEREQLVPGNYKVDIKTTLKPGVLNYGEIVIPGKSKREVFFSTYVCHPSMANNELSGPVLAVQLASFVKELNPNLTYKFLFIPETIGSIAYIANNLPHLKENLLAGFVLTCVGDDRSYSYLPSRLGGTVADRVALETFESLDLPYVRYTWKDRGSDERQYCAPGIDLPVCSVMRTKYGDFPEYHTSLDRLGTVVTPSGLQGIFNYYSAVVQKLEAHRYPKVNTLGEPQLGKRGLYPTISIKGAYADVIPMKNVISELDGNHSLEEIAERTGLSLEKVTEISDTLIEKGLVSQ
jgi:aminopeptidase-like protein